MKNILLLLLFISSFNSAFTQIKKDNFKELGTKYVHQFFELFNKSDTTVLSYFSNEAIMTSTGEKGFQNSSPSGLISELQKLKGRYEEVISNISVTGDYYTMVVSMDYHFYFDKELHHCGKNFFVLSKNMQKPMTYQIVSLSDSRTNCEEQIIQNDSIKSKLDRKMLAWHKAAGKADYENYFNPMDSTFIYIGTDPSERWTKEEFSSFCKPYFSKGKGWDFKTITRTWASSMDGSTFWFDELLDTHMGTCRGSGVWQMIDGEWKILHYNLALTIYNDKMEAVKKVNIK